LTAFEEEKEDCEKRASTFLLGVFWKFGGGGGCWGGVGWVVRIVIEVKGEGWVRRGLVGNGEGRGGNCVLRRGVGGGDMGGKAGGRSGSGVLEIERRGGEPSLLPLREGHGGRSQIRKGPVWGGVIQGIGPLGWFDESKVRRSN